jgi:hypothetical protein
LLENFEDAQSSEKIFSRWMRANVSSGHGRSLARFAGAN